VKAVKPVSGIEYGGDEWEVDVPEQSIVIEGPETPLEAVFDPLEACREAVARPLDMPPLGELVGEGSKVCIAFNDWAGCTAVAAPVLLGELQRAGVRDRDLTFISAGGMHPRLSRDEYLLCRAARWAGLTEADFPSWGHILPRDIVDRFFRSSEASSQIRPHDASDPDNVYLGETEYGDYVAFNKAAVEADQLIYVSGWGGTPSMWGGYLGGGVGIAVGLGDTRTNQDMHHHRVIDDPESHHASSRSQLFMKHKQAVAKFYEQATGKRVFYVEALLTCAGEWGGFWAGSGEAVREPQWALADKEKIVTVPTQADIMIFGSGPYGYYDVNDNPIVAMAQANQHVRQYVRPTPILRPGGVVIMAATCGGKIDDRYRPADREVLEIWQQIGRRGDILADQYYEEFAHRDDLIWKYRFAHGAHPLHTFFLVLESVYILNQASRIYFVGARDPGAALAVGATPADTFDKALAEAVSLTGKSDPDILVLPNSTKRFPILLKVGGNGSGQA
jgi:nickel-dependent lactate racemase